MEAAADTLRTLREEAPKLQRWVRLLADNTALDCYMARDVETLLRKLGVEP